MLTTPELICYQCVNNINAQQIVLKLENNDLIKEQNIKYLQLEMYSNSGCFIGYNSIAFGTPLNFNDNEDGQIVYTIENIDTIFSDSLELNLYFQNLETSILLICKFGNVTQSDYSEEISFIVSDFDQYNIIPMDGGCSDDCYMDGCSDTCSGTCTFGCWGSDCSSACMNTCYGSDCSGTCRNGCYGSDCSGTCRNGCYRSDCSSACMNACYGSDCSSACHSNCTSTCSGGCFNTCQSGCFISCSGSCLFNCSGSSFGLLKK